MRVEKAIQLSVVIDNKVGNLAGLYRLIDEHKIYVTAICTVDTVEELIVRIVAKDVDEARKALASGGFHVNESDVLLLDIANRPGVSGAVAAAIAGMNFKIDYIYGSAHVESPRKILVLRTHFPGADTVLSEVSKYIEEHY